MFEGKVLDVQSATKVRVSVVPGTRLKVKFARGFAVRFPPHSALNAPVLAHYYFIIKNKAADRG